MVHVLPIVFRYWQVPGNSTVKCWFLLKVNRKLPHHSHWQSFGRAFVTMSATSSLLSDLRPSGPFCHDFDKLSFHWLTWELEYTVSSPELHTWNKLLPGPFYIVTFGPLRTHGTRSGRNSTRSVQDHEAMVWPTKAQFGISRMYMTQRS